MLNIPAMSLDERLDKYIRGLKPFIQKELLIKDPLTIEEACRVAERIDTISY